WPDASNIPARADQYVNAIRSAPGAGSLWITQCQFWKSVKPTKTYPGAPGYFHFWRQVYKHGHCMTLPEDAWGSWEYANNATKRYSDLMTDILSSKWLGRGPAAARNFVMPEQSMDYPPVPWTTPGFETHMRRLLRARATSGATGTESQPWGAFYF